MRNLRMNTTKMVRSIPNRQAIPGASLGIKNMREFRKVTSELMHIKGFSFVVIAGQQDFPQLQLVSSADFLYGITLNDLNADPQNLFTLTVNNDKVIDAVSNLQLSRIAPASYNQEYFPINCPLSGNDTLIASYFGNTAGSTVLITLWLHTNTDFPQR